MKKVLWRSSLCSLPLSRCIFFFPSALSCLCLSCVKENYSRHCPFRVFLDTKYFLLILVVPAPLSHCFITFFFFLLCPLLLCKEKQSLVTCSLRPKCVVYIYIHTYMFVCVPSWLETIEMSACFGMLTAVSYMWCD